MDVSSIFETEKLEQQSIFWPCNVFRRQIVSLMTPDKGNLVISKLLMLTVIQMRSFVYDYAFGLDKWEKEESFQPFVRQIDMLSMSIVVDDPECEEWTREERRLFASILKTLQRVCITLNIYEPKEIVKYFQDTEADYRSLMSNNQQIAFIVVGLLYLINKDGLEVLSTFWESYAVKRIKKKIRDTFWTETYENQPPLKRKRPLEKDLD